MDNKKANYEIRLAGPEHIEQISDLYIRNFRDAYEGILSPDYLDSMNMEDTCAKWRDYIAQPHHGIYVMMEIPEDGGPEKVGGMVGYKPYFRIENCFYVYSLYIEKHLRGKGIGTALVKKVAEVGRAEGYPLLGVCFVDANDNARRLYTKLGAVHRMYIEDHFAGDPVKSEVMVWDLLDDSLK